jgi:hypothetical protein
MDLHRLATLFSYEPVAASFLFFLITITAVAFVVLACLGTFSLWVRLRKKRGADARQAAAVA